MRRIAKRDGNHSAIVKALEAVGAIVQDLSSVGSGVPDLLVGHAGRNWLIEVKDPKQRHRLTPAQVEWHRRWAGQKAVVETPADALRAIGLDVM